MFCVRWFVTASSRNEATAGSTIHWMRRAAAGAGPGGSRDGSSRAPAVARSVYTAAAAHSAAKSA
jgi:hypothetical protein